MRMPTKDRTSIAVIIPAFNGSRFIAKAIESVLAQTRPADEIIVVDDGSTDGTAEIASKYPVALIQQANAGVSVARNRAIAEAKSSWIAFLDQDDWYHPQKLEAHEATLEGDVVLSYSRCCVVENGHEVMQVTPEVTTIRKLLRYRNTFTPGSVVVRRSVLWEIGGFDAAVNGCEDWELWMRLLDRGRFVAADSALLFVNIHPEAYSRKPDKMLQSVEKAMPTLLRNTAGWERTAARLRIMAGQYASASVMCRNEDEIQALGYCFKSVLAWPPPNHAPSRYKLLAVQLLRTGGSIVRGYLGRGGNSSSRAL
jgi:glycosyltransferase involved in cell wall biosynthesis